MGEAYITIPNDPSKLVDGTTYKILHTIDVDAACGSRGGTKTTRYTIPSGTVVKFGGYLNWYYSEDDVTDSINYPNQLGGSFQDSVYSSTVTWNISVSGTTLTVTGGWYEYRSSSIVGQIVLFMI